MLSTQKNLAFCNLTPSPTLPQRAPRPRPRRRMREVAARRVPEHPPDHRELLAVVDAAVGVVRRELAQREPRAAEPAMPREVRRQRRRRVAVGAERGGGDRLLEGASAAAAAANAAAAAANAAAAVARAAAARVAAAGAAAARAAVAIAAAGAAIASVPVATPSILRGGGARRRGALPGRPRSRRP